MCCHESSLGDHLVIDIDTSPLVSNLKAIGRLLMEIFILRENCLVIIMNSVKIINSVIIRNITMWRILATVLVSSLVHYFIDSYGG